MTSRRRFLAGFGLVLATGALVAPASADVRPHAGMLRYPDVSATHIAFVYANDVWTVPRDGGVATPLASPPGQESMPRFSPDGKTIAFVGNYDGNRDIYTIPTAGGVPHRVTHHPGGETLCDWTPDGRLMFFTNGMGGLRRQSRLFTVDAEGGLPQALPVPYGANGSLNDGGWLAYTPLNTDNRTWKRYRGGMATDIWLFHVERHESKRITDWEGTDSQPMWHGDTVYYTSDAGPSHRGNIWAYSTATGEHRQVTKFSDFDVKWPAIGPGKDGGGEIVFQQGSGLYLLDLPTGETRRVEVTVPGDRPHIRARSVDASKTVQSWSLSATGKRAVFSARGDIWTVPAKEGPARNLTRSSGVAERAPSWSPDGKWVSYLSDESGEYEWFVTRSDGREPPRRLTEDGSVFRYRATWSPDSKRMVFFDKTGALWLHTVESGETKLVVTDPWVQREPVSWSHDSGWLAFSMGGEGNQRSVFLYEVATGTATQVTSELFDDSRPTFDRKGDFLYFVSARDFTRPVYEDGGPTFIYTETEVLLAVPLRADVEAPFRPESDEETWKDEKKDDDEDPDESGGDDDDDAGDGNSDDEEEKDGKKKDKDADPEPLVIELDGFERRAVRLPVDKGRFASLAVTDKGKLLYARLGPRAGRAETKIQLFDAGADEPEEETVLEGTGAFSMSADGKKLLVAKSGSYAVIEPKAGQKMKDKLDLSGMRAAIDPRAEWRQILTDAWRVQRDFFYAPNMHGVDWKGMHDHYAAMLDDCVSREDVSYVIREMISELNVGHAYYWGGDVEQAPSESVGMLGVDFELAGGAYRIKRIHEGGAWDDDARGPLSQPGVDAEVGDYVLEVNGTPITTRKDPWAAFQGLAGRTATLALSDKPVLDDSARRIVVKLLANENSLRYRAWVESKRRYVEERTDGKVGYVYVPNTGRNGQNELFRQFYGQTHKQALIIDERWNGGGQIPTRFIELLNRPVTNYWARRDGRDWTWPYIAHHGPKCMLINGSAGSGGDAFPAYFRQAGLGKLVGMRTWGGLVGISGNPRLIDGGYTSAPTFAYYEKDGTWGIEGHGVDPDIEVIDDPALMVDGGDPQLDRAIELMLEEVRARPYVKPGRPPYPDRSGMGLTDEDK